MREVSTDNFGLLIAYLLPGFVALWGGSFFSSTVRLWLGFTPLDAPTVGGFLYVTLGSTAAGLIVSAIRWSVLDRLYHRTGIPEPRWDFARLQDRLPTFNLLVEYHYRYYQFYGNMLVAIVLSYVAWLLGQGYPPGQGGWPELALLFVLVVLWLGSRDTLRKYYSRVSRLVESAAEPRLVD